VQVGARVAVAVLTWRGEAQSRSCLESLRQLAQWPADILVVDNDSGTGEGDRLASDFGVAGLTLPRNGGVAYGYNAAMRWARQAGCSHVLLMNNDVVLPRPDVIDLLVEAMDGSTAAAGPVVRDEDGNTWSAGGTLQWWTGNAKRLRRPRSESPYAVDWLDGSAMLVRLEAACKVGGLSEDFFLYWEETDWCVRAARAKFRCVVQPEASITHARGASATSRQTRSYALRNSLLFMRRNGSLAANVTSTLAWLFVRLPIYFVRRRGEGERLREATRDAVEALAWNLGDAIRRRSWRVAADGPGVCTRDLP
jgi:GT2 family glycosyltransferase